METSSSCSKSSLLAAGLEGHLWHFNPLLFKVVAGIKQHWKDNFQGNLELAPAHYLGLWRSPLAGVTRCWWTQFGSCFMVTHDINIFFFKHFDQAVPCVCGVISQLVVWLYPDCTVIDGHVPTNVPLSWCPGKGKLFLLFQQAAYLWLQFSGGWALSWPDMIPGWRVLQLALPAGILFTWLAFVAESQAFIDFIWQTDAHALPFWMLRLWIAACEFNAGCESAPGARNAEKNTSTAWKTGESRR